MLSYASVLEASSQLLFMSGDNAFESHSSAQLDLFRSQLGHLMPENTKDATS